jgi:PEGA domain
MRPHFAILAAIAGSLAACASNSGVVPIGPDTFMVSRQAATGFSGLGNLKAEALREAQQYCTSHGKVMQIVNSTESQPPYVLGNFPKAEIQFMCLNANDPELARPKMRKEPDVVIQKTSVSQPDSYSPVKVPILSEPTGADVLVDGIFVGNTPLSEFWMSPGDHVVELKRAGFVVWSRTIRITANTPSHITATLEPVPKQ